MAGRKKTREGGAIKQTNPTKAIYLVGDGDAWESGRQGYNPRRIGGGRVGGRGGSGGSRSTAVEEEDEEDEQDKFDRVARESYQEAKAVVATWEAGSGSKP